MPNAKQVATKALESFWKTVAESYPDCSGDIDAHADMRFTQHAEEIVEAFVETNVVTHNGAHTDIQRPSWLREMGFEDYSWSNDACARMELALNKAEENTESIAVWVEHENRLSREDLRCPRYRVQACIEDGDLMAGYNMLPGVEHDVAAQAQVERLQTAYAAKGKQGLREQLELEQKWSFEHFQASKREATPEDRTALGIEDDVQYAKVWLYADNYWLAEQADDAYFLLIESDTYLTHDLALQERRLFDFAVSSGSLHEQELPEHMESKNMCVCGEIRPCAHLDKRVDGEWHYSESFRCFLRYNADTEMYEESPRWLDGKRTDIAREIDPDMMEPSAVRMLHAFFVGEVN